MKTQKINLIGIANRISYYKKLLEADEPGKIDTFKYNSWYWKVLISGIVMTSEQDYKNGLRDTWSCVLFTRELIPLLPSPIPVDKKHLYIPASMPGEFPIFKLEISETKDPEKTLELFKTYFPLVFSLNNQSS